MDEYIIKSALEKVLTLAAYFKMQQFHPLSDLKNVGAEC